MKITDETKTFRGESDLLASPSLAVSSNRTGTHEAPSLCLHVKTGDRPPLEAAYGTSDTDQIKEIIEHMAKMAGLSVSFSERFEPRYRPGDRVRSIMEDHGGQLGTVLDDKEHPHGWNVRVRLDGDTDTGLFTYDELEPVTKNS